MFKNYFKILNDTYLLTKSAQNFKGLYLKLLFSSVLLVFVDSIGILAFIPIFEVFFNQSFSNENLNILSEIDFINLKNLSYKEKVVYISFFLIAIATVKSLLNIYSNFISTKFINTVHKYLTKYSFTCLVATNSLFIESIQKGELRNFCQTIPARIAQLSNEYIRLLSSVLISTIYFLFLINISFYLTIIVIVISLVLSIGWISLTRYQSKIGLALNKDNISFNQIVIETIMSIKLINIYNLKNFFFNKLNIILKKKINTQLKMGLLNNISSPLLSWFSGLILFSILIFFAFTEQTFSWVPNFMLFSFILLRLLTPITNFNQSRVIVALNSPMVKSYNDFLYLLTSNKIKNGKKKITFFKNKIIFKNVCYKIREKKIINNLSFDLIKGSNIAFVGKSGSGKSTIINLLLKLVKPTSGEITIDGVNFNEIQNDSLYKIISPVLQSSNYIYNSSLKDNITLNRFHTKERVDILINKVNLNNLNKKNSLVGEGGSKLSGGEIQRIAIARALLKESQIYVFDESTSQIDTITEKKIYDKKKSLMNSTTITIAHSLYTVKDVDTIYVIHNGTIYSKGSHSFLKKSCVKYKNLLKNQIIK